MAGDEVVVRLFRSFSRHSPDAASDDGQYGRYWRFSQAGCRFDENSVMPWDRRIDHNRFEYFTRRFYFDRCKRFILGADRFAAGRRSSRHAERR
jgi:hypothetical protein